MDPYYNYNSNYDYDYNYSYNFNNQPVSNNQPIFDNQPIWGSDYFPSSASFQPPPPAPPPAAVANSDDEASLMLAESCPKKRAGRKKFKETRHPVYRGIRKRNNNKWVCELRATSNDKFKQHCASNSRIWLGTYPTAEMAARAHDVAALALRGRNACLNFADSASILRVPTSGDIKDIQRAAAEAAEMFNPSPHQWPAEQNPSLVVTVEDDEAADQDEVVTQEDGAGAGYMDEAADMQSMLARMSEGTLLSPPHHHQYHGSEAQWGGYGHGWDDQMDSSDNATDLSLWSWS